MLSYTNYTILNGREGLRKFLRYYQNTHYPKAAPHFRDVADLQAREHLLLGAQNYKGALYGAAIVVFPRLGLPNNMRLHHHFARAHCARLIFTAGHFHPLIEMACAEAKARHYQTLCIPYESASGFEVFWNTDKKKKVLEHQVYAEPNRRRRVGQVLTA